MSITGTIQKQTQTDSQDTTLHRLLESCGRRLPDDVKQSPEYWDVESQGFVVVEYKPSEVPEGEKLLDFIRRKTSRNLQCPPIQMEADRLQRLVGERGIRIPDGSQNASTMPREEVLLRLASWSDQEAAQAALRRYDFCATHTPEEIEVKLAEWAKDLLLREAKSPKEEPSWIPPEQAMGDGTCEQKIASNLLEELRSLWEPMPEDWELVPLGPFAKTPDDSKANPE